MISKTKNTVTLVVIVLVTLIGLGFAMALHRNTLVDWWLPAVVCAVPAALLAALYTRLIMSLAGLSRPWMAACAGFALFFTALLGTAYSLNYFDSDPDSSLQCKATVSAKYTAERHRSKRVGRNRYVQGEPYTVYFIKMDIPGGRVKELEVTAGQYAGLRKGQSIDLQIERGLLGVPVIKNMRLPDKSRDRSQKRKHVKPNL